MQNIQYSCCLYSTKHKNKLIDNFQKQLNEDICNEVKDITLTNSFEQIYQWLIDKRIKNLIIPYQTTGNNVFSTTFLNKINLLGINYNFYLRDWDHNAFPYCNKGFFHFKKTINELLDLASIS